MGPMGRCLTHGKLQNTVVLGSSSAEIAEASHTTATLLTHQQSDSADMFEFTKTHVKQSSTYSKLLENRDFQSIF